MVFASDYVCTAHLCHQLTFGQLETCSILYHWQFEIFIGEFILQLTSLIHCEILFCVYVHVWHRPGTIQNSYKLLRQKFVEFFSKFHPGLNFLRL